MARPRIINLVFVAAALLTMVGLALLVRIGPTADRVALLTTRGITGGCCDAAIKKALQSVRGVASVTVDRVGEKVIVGFDSHKAAPAKFAAAVTAAGYPSTVQKVETVAQYRAETGGRPGGGAAGSEQTAESGGCGGCCSQNRN